MPELPEVETVRRQLLPLLVGTRITAGWSYPSWKFTDAVLAVGHRIREIRRRGKYLLIDLGPEIDQSGKPELELVLHLGMTGTLSVTDNPPDDPYVRAIWSLDKGSYFWLRDIRRFGRIAMVPRDDYCTLPTLSRLGPEPFDPDLTAETFYQSLTGSRRRIKTQLLSQRPVAGVGNIYADEALWRARIYPGCRRVGRIRAGQLLSHLRNVLSESLENGGTTLRDYRKPDGGTGSNQRHLDCYGRSGQACRRCATTLVARMLDQRSTTWCPVCQRH